MDELGVASSSIPVTLHWLWLKSTPHAVLLAHAVHQVTRHEKVVARLNAFARSDLVLPLTRHDLCVGARDLNASKLWKEQ